MNRDMETKAKERYKKVTMYEKMRHLDEWKALKILYCIIMGSRKMRPTEENTSNRITTLTTHSVRLSQ